MEEGGWHSRIMGEFRQEDIENITYFVNVKDVVTADTSTLRQTGSFDNKEGETVIDIYFDDLRAVLPDTPRIAELLGVPAEQIVYNYPLLAMYLIRDSRDTAPRLVFPLFIVITAMASFSLIVIIHNAFAVSMNARIHQFGIFSSIGATPKQIRTCLLQEAAALCAVPILLSLIHI